MKSWKTTLCGVACWIVMGFAIADNIERNAMAYRYWLPHVALFFTGLLALCARDHGVSTEEARTPMRKPGWLRLELILSPRIFWPAMGVGLLVSGLLGGITGKQLWIMNHRVTPTAETNSVSPIADTNSVDALGLAYTNALKHTAEVIQELERTIVAINSDTNRLFIGGDKPTPK